MTPYRNSIAREPRMDHLLFTYRPGMHCPGCAATAWHIGRVTAECARCKTALPIADQRVMGRAA